MNWEALRVEDTPKDIKLIYSCDKEVAVTDGAKVDRLKSAEVRRKYYIAELGNGVFMRMEYDGDILWYYANLEPIGLSFTCAMERLINDK